MTDQSMRAWLAFFLGIAISFVLWGLFFVQIDQDNRETLNLVLGALLAKLTDVYGYSFGSSAENTKNSHTISKMAETQNVAQAVLAAAVPGTAPDTIKLEPGQAAQAPPAQEPQE